MNNDDIVKIPREEYARLVKAEAMLELIEATASSGYVSKELVETIKRLEKEVF